MNKIEVPILKAKIKNHFKIKENILNILNKNSFKEFTQKDDYINDYIHKLDWFMADDPNREWFKIVQQPLYETLLNMAQSIGFTEIALEHVWFQQYQQKGRHGWHVHGFNYTGVYYLEYNKKENPPTEFLYPCNLKEKFSIDVEEGDIISFPSFIIHRAPINNSLENKTIISFNLDFKTPNSDITKI
jgi:uncharacterized RmlC-like cupin family protein